MKVEAGMAWCNQPLNANDSVTREVAPAMQSGDSKCANSLMEAWREVESCHTHSHTLLIITHNTGGAATKWGRLHMHLIRRFVNVHFINMGKAYNLQM